MSFNARLLRRFLVGSAACLAVSACSADSEPNTAVSADSGAQAVDDATGVQDVGTANDDVGSRVDTGNQVQDIPKPPEDMGGSPDVPRVAPVDPCEPNPCEVPNKSKCLRDGAQPWCGCDDGFAPDGLGGCTDDPCGVAGCPSDPCEPNPCNVPGKSQCLVDGSLAHCMCDAGLWPDGLGGCTADPCLPDGCPSDLCDPNPCQVPNKTTCVLDGAQIACICNDGYESDGSGACVVACTVDCEPPPVSTSCDPDPCADVEDQVCIEGQCVTCLDDDGDGYGKGPGCIDFDCDESDATKWDGCPCNTVVCPWAVPVQSPSSSNQVTDLGEVLPHLFAASIPHHGLLRVNVGFPLTEQVFGTADLLTALPAQNGDFFSNEYEVLPEEVYLTAEFDGTVAFGTTKHFNWSFRPFVADLEELLLQPGVSMELIPTMHHEWQLLRLDLDPGEYYSFESDCPEVREATVRDDGTLQTSNSPHNGILRKADGPVLLVVEGFPVCTLQYESHGLDGDAVGPIPLVPGTTKVPLMLGSSDQWVLNTEVGKAYHVEVIGVVSSLTDPSGSEATTWTKTYTVDDSIVTAFLVDGTGGPLDLKVTGFKKPYQVELLVFDLDQPPTVIEPGKSNLVRKLSPMHQVTLQTQGTVPGESYEWKKTAFTWSVNGDPATESYLPLTAEWVGHYSPTNPSFDFGQGDTTLYTITSVGPDDYPATSANAPLVELPFEVRRHGPGDVDWVSFAVKPGYSYRVDTSGAIVEVIGLDALGASANSWFRPNGTGTIQLRFELTGSTDDFSLPDEAAIVGFEDEFGNSWESAGPFEFPTMHASFVDPADDLDWGVTSVPAGSYKVEGGWAYVLKDTGDGVQKVSNFAGNFTLSEPESVYLLVSGTGEVDATITAWP